MAARSECKGCTCRVEEYCNYQYNGCPKCYDPKEEFAKHMDGAIKELGLILAADVDAKGFVSECLDHIETIQDMWRKYLAK